MSENRGAFILSCFTKGMKYKKVNLVLFSPTRTSFRVAECVAEGMGADETEVTDLTYKGVPELVCAPNDLVVFAVPVYGGRVSETALERLATVRGCCTPAVVVVVYGNRDYEDALLELRDFSVDAGFIPVAGGAFVGEHSYSRKNMPIAMGRPDQNDQKIAMEWGRKIKQKLEEIVSTEKLLPVEVKGNMPYKVKGPKTPVASTTIPDLCTVCGDCAAFCPTQAIVMKVKPETDPRLCIKCCACVKQCPTQARVFDTPYTGMLFTHYSFRREPELFETSSFQ